MENNWKLTALLNCVVGADAVHVQDVSAYETLRDSGGI